MSEPFDENGFIRLGEYEIDTNTSTPDETPRQFLKRTTDRDFPELAYDGRDYTWQEIRDAGLMPVITRILEIAYIPRIFLRKKEE